MRITHGRITLELHELAKRSGPTLLLLHALGGSSEDWGETPATWAGSVFALDFCGHGRSDWLAGGAYYPELLLGDADAALAAVGDAAVAGAGLGAYLALLLAGARPELVHGALLLPGCGLAGGGPQPDFDREVSPLLISGEQGSAPRTSSASRTWPPVDSRPSNDAPSTSPSCDPLVHALDLIVRPVDYAETFARAARALMLVEDGEPRPPWWAAARLSPAAEALTADLQCAFSRLAQHAAGEAEIR